MLCYLICFDSQFCQLTNKLLFLTCSLKIRFFFLVFSQIVPIWYWSTLLLFLKYRVGRQLLIFYFLYFYTNRPHCGPVSYWPYFQLLFPHKLFFFSWKLLPSLSFDHNYRDRNVNVHKKGNCCIRRWLFFSFSWLRI